MASTAVFFKCVNSLGSYKSLITSRLSNPLYQQVATLRKETKTKLASLNIPEPPKRPLTAYFRFLAEHRESVKNSNPNLKLIEITKQCAYDWTHLDSKLKEKFHSDYTKDLEEYAKKQNAFASSLTEEQVQALKLARQEKKDDKVKRSIKQRFRETSKPKQPLGSFLFFIKDKWTLPENKNKKLPEMLQAYKGHWSEMSELQKEKYVKLQQIDRERYETEIAEWELRMVKEGNSDLIRKDSQIITKAKSDKPKESSPEKKPKSKTIKKKSD